MTELSERFWSKVNKNGPEARPGLGPCWLWTASTNGHGYGQFARLRGFPGKRSPRAAHRASLEEKLGRLLLPGMEAMHDCDVRLCVNPSHLFEGTRAENMRDASTRGRVRRGDNKSQSKLTSFDVTVIRRSRGSVKELAPIFGVSAAAIYHVRKGSTWAHLR